MTDLDKEIEALIGGSEEDVPAPEPSDGIPLVTSSIDHQTVFADAAWYASNMGNVIRITFIENILEPQNSPSPGLKACHVGTLAIPRVGFDNMVDYLTEMREFFRKLDEDAANVSS